MGIKADLLLSSSYALPFTGFRNMVHKKVLSNKVDLALATFTIMKEEDCVFLKVPGLGRLVSNFISRIMQLYGKAELVFIPLRIK